MAIAPQGLESIRAHHAMLTKGLLSAGARRSGASTPQPARTGVIPVLGPLSQRPNFLSDLMGWSDYQSISTQLQAALADPSTDTVLLYIDSPGGTTSGLPETADEIYAARAVKPIVAYATGLCASAAFWLGSQASRLVAQPSAEIGSVGVIAVHLDYSQQLANEGIKPTIIASSTSKGELSPLVPLTADARAHQQRQIDVLHGEFVAALARGRRVSTSTVNANFGQGRTCFGREALRVGMVDALAPNLGAALGHAIGKGSRTSASAGPTTRARMQRELEVLKLS
jgi:signal peptide peptidase SppA